MVGSTAIMQSFCQYSRETLGFPALGRIGPRKYETQAGKIHMLDIDRDHSLIDEHGLEVTGTEA